MVVIYTYGFFDSFTKELLYMFNYFGTGLYVNNVTPQEEYFGPAPSPEQVIGRYVDGVLKAAEASS